MALSPQTRRRLVAATWWLCTALALVLCGVLVGRPLHYSDGNQLVAADALANAAMRHWLPPEPRVELPGPLRGRIARAPDGRLVYGQARGEHRTDLVAFDPNRPELPPEPLLLVNSSAHDLAPAFGPDGALYFASDRTGGAGGYDLYRAPLRGGTWSAPEPLLGLNSSLDDIDPAVHDQELVFVRSDPQLAAGHHAELLRRAADGTAVPLWLAPRGRHDPVQDREPVFSADGGELWFVRRQSARLLSLQVATRLGSDYAAPQPAPEALQLRTARSPLPGEDGLRLGLLQVGEDGGATLYYESTARLLAPYRPGQDGLVQSLFGLVLALLLLALLLQWGARWATLDLLALCLLASLLLHLLVMAWLMGVELAASSFGRRSREAHDGLATVVFASAAPSEHSNGSGDASLAASPQAFAADPPLQQAAALQAMPAEAMVVAAPDAALPAPLAPQADTTPLPATLAIPAASAAAELMVMAPRLEALPAPVQYATAPVDPHPASDAVWSSAMGSNAVATLSRPSYPTERLQSHHQPAKPSPLPMALDAGLTAPAADLPTPQSADFVSPTVATAASDTAPHADLAARPRPPQLAAVPAPPQTVAATPLSSAPPSPPDLRSSAALMAQPPLADKPAATPPPKPKVHVDGPADPLPLADVAMPDASLPAPSLLAPALPRQAANLRDIATSSAATPTAPTLRSELGPAGIARQAHSGHAAQLPLELALATPPGLVPQPPTGALPAPHAFWRGSLPWPELPPPTPPGASLPAPPPLPAASAPAPALAVAEAYSNRFGPQKAAALRQFGGSQATERAVAQGLRYLASRQRPAGCFGDPSLRDAKYGSTAIGKTALCLLAFLGAGHTGAADDEHGEVVRRAVDWLLAQQDATGAVGTGSCYGHGIATYALAECYGLTHDERLELPLQGALQWIVRHQGPRRDRKNRGGWGYFGPGTPVEDDFARVSVSAWMVMALRAAELSGFGLPPKVLGLAREYFEESFDSQNGWFRYTQKPSRLASSWPTLPASTPAGAFCLLLLGSGADDAKVTAALDYTLQRAPQAYRSYPDDDFVRRAQGNVYFWYYATLASFVAGGEAWQAWNDRLQRVLVPAQAADGSFAPIDTYARLAGDDAADACYTTALCVLCLEVYYRYFTPLLQAR